VAPFILRGVQLLGVDSVNARWTCSQTLWNRLAVQWRPDRCTIRFARSTSRSLPEHFDAYLKGMVRGRMVVRIGADTIPAR